MLTVLTEYAVSKGLPYDFVEWALDNYGYDIDESTNFEAIANDWQSVRYVRALIISAREA